MKYYKAKSNNKKIKNIIMLIIGVCLLVGVLFFVAKALALVDEYGLENILNHYEDKAKFIYFAICYLQPIILPLPEPLTIMTGSTIFGPALGATIGFLGTILGIITMFLIGKFASKKYIEKIVSEENLKKFNKYREKNETIVLMGLFILPILPDEIICIGGGVAQIKTFKFILIATVAKLITAITLSYSLSVLNVSMSQVLTIAMIGIIIVYVIKKIFEHKKERSN